MRCFFVKPGGQIARLRNKKKKGKKTKPMFCHDNSQRDWHGNVHDNVNVFGLGGIDLLRCCGRANTETCYCQYIHNMLL